MEKKYTKQQLETKLEKVKAKLKEYKKKLKITPAILFTVLYTFIFTLMFPITGIVGVIKALIGGFGAIGTSIYFWIYREKTEPKYEEYVKFLEEELKQIETELSGLSIVNTQEENIMSSKIVSPVHKNEKQTSQVEEKDNDLDINTL